MAYTLLTAPATWSSANDDLIYVLIDTNYTQTNYKYICDVYINGSFVSRLKTYPSPLTHHGVFNIGNIVRNYVESNFNLTSLGAIVANIFEQHKASVVCKFGYEYGVPVSATYNVIVDENRDYFNNSNRRLIYNQYVRMNSVLRDFATTRTTPYNVIYPTSPFAINRSTLIPYFIWDDAAPGYMGIQIRVIYNNGTEYIDVYDMDEIDFNYTLIQMDLSPYAINSTFGSGTINSNTISYYITILLPDEQESRQLQFDMYCEPKYTPITLVWMNEFGGYESYDFTKVSRRSIETTKKTYSQLPYYLNSGYNYALYKNTIKKEQSIIYDSKYKEKLTLNTGIINEATYKWLDYLLISPSVFLQEPNGSFSPVIVTDKNYEYKTKLNDKAFNMTLNIEFSETMNAQYR